MNAVRMTSRTGLACAGGVIEGAIYEAGVLYALDEAISGIDFNRLDTYVGVSSGAFLSALLANGVPPRELCRAVAGRARDPSLNVSFEEFFRPAFREYRKRLGSWPGVAWEALWRYARDPLDFSPFGSLAELGAAMPVGLFDNEGLRERLCAILAGPGRTEDFRQLDTALLVVTMHVDSAETTVFGPDTTPHVPISKAVQASTALPVLYCPVEIDGEYYIDGVARRTLNASLALDDDVDLLFCVNPIVPVDASWQELRATADTDSLVDHGLPTILSQTFRSMVYSRRQSGFRSYEHLYPDADVVLVEPQAQDIGRIFSNVFSYSNRHAVCEYGYRSTRETLLRRADEIGPKLERHGLHLRMNVLDDETRSLFPRRASRYGSGALPATGSTSDVLGRLDAVLGRLETTLDEGNGERRRRAA